VNITGGNRDGEGQFTATCSGAADNAGNITPPIAVTYDVVRDVSRSVRLHTEFRSTEYRNGRMTVRNISEEKYLRPAASVLTDLPPGVTLANATGTYLGNPYITIPGVTTLKPGDAASVEVEFNNLSNVKVGFTPVTYAGQFDGGEARRFSGPEPRVSGWSNYFALPLCSQEACPRTIERQWVVHFPSDRKVCVISRRAC
jgi:hypothetical protein